MKIYSTIKSKYQYIGTVPNEEGAALLKRVIVHLKKDGYTESEIHETFWFIKKQRDLPKHINRHYGGFMVRVCIGGENYRRTFPELALAEIHLASVQRFKKDGLNVPEIKARFSHV